MNNHDRNARTLVVCFVLAMMSLMSLRFVEVGQSVTAVSGSQVLGATSEKKEVVLPNAEVHTQVLEANYIGN